jgi:hypothetical protein
LGNSAEKEHGTQINADDTELNSRSEKVLAAETWLGQTWTAPLESREKLRLQAGEGRRIACPTIAGRRVALVRAFACLY